LGRLPHPPPHLASIYLSQGTNLLQLSRALGHHSPAFTLTRYTHLLPGDEAPALELDAAPFPNSALGAVEEFSRLESPPR
jgi:hypothetical protein